jgi:4-amino-4-deoxychorismate lyase
MKTPPITNILFETIKVEDGIIFNIKWHNERCNKSRKELFKSTNELLLQEYISPPRSGLYRCKISYNQTVQSVEYFPYKAKTFKHFKVVKSNLNYSYKYTNREALEKLFKHNYDEVIIEKDGLITDTSIANIAFFDGESWLTPTTPLLEGTTRARLLSEGFLILGDIRKEEIKNYSHFALMNAMLGFRIQKSVSLQM